MFNKQQYRLEQHSVGEKRLSTFSLRAKNMKIDISVNVIFCQKKYLFPRLLVKEINAFSLGNSKFGHKLKVFLCTQNVSTL